MQADSISRYPDNLFLILKNRGSNYLLKYILLSYTIA
jgi:hypothetical protein